MSLDITLYGEESEVTCRCSECGNEHAHKERVELYSSNITHNLGRMAEEAGIYKHLWRPEEIGITKASQLIEPLRAGLDLVLSDPKRFKKFDAPNGWGTYEHFVPWLNGYLEACVNHPEATVQADR